MLRYFERIFRFRQRVNFPNPHFLSLVLVSASSILFSIRLFSFISQHSVNILFWDQWGFYSPIFDQKNLWEIFNLQHGPHRQGIGLIFTKILADATHWNTRADSFAIGGILLIGMLLALVLKKKLFGSLTPTDIVIPIIFLTTSQYEAFIGTPNLSHSAFPLLLTILYCLGWLIRNRYVKYVFILCLNYVLIYTGFGIFMGPVTVLLLMLDCYQNIRAKKKVPLLSSSLALLISLLSFYTFSIDYIFNPAVDCFGFSLSNVLKYPQFVSLMYAKFLGLGFDEYRSLAITIGNGALFFAVASFVYHGKRIVTSNLHSSRVSLVINVLLGYSLLFSLATSVGRLCLGLGSAQSSRYMTLLIPTFLGLYFYLLTFRKINLRQMALVFYIAILMFGLLQFGPEDKQIINFYTINKENWKNCYLEIEDIDKCNEQTGFKIYPTTDVQLERKMNYLKQNHLNLYLDVNNQD